MTIMSDVISASSDTEGDHVAVQHAVALLRERVYGAMACLTTIAVLVRYTAESSAWALVLDVAVATGALCAASLLSDWLAHVGGHRSVPQGRTALRMLRPSGQIVEAAILPLLLLVAAGFGLLSSHTAMWIAIWVLIVELGVIALLAVRRTELRWWQQLLTISALVGLGVLLVAVKILAH